MTKFEKKLKKISNISFFVFIILFIRIITAGYMQKIITCYPWEISITAPISIISFIFCLTAKICYYVEQHERKLRKE
jgi:hypothetical protein